MAKHFVGMSMLRSFESMGVVSCSYAFKHCGKHGKSAVARLFSSGWAPQNFVYPPSPPWCQSRMIGYGCEVPVFLVENITSVQKGGVSFTRLCDVTNAGRWYV